MERRIVLLICISSVWLFSFGCTDNNNYNSTTDESVVQSQIDENSSFDDNTRNIQHIVLSSSSCEITVGEIYQVKYIIVPENATDKDLSWKSVDPQIAAVNSEGVITGISDGNTNIVVSSSQDVFATISVSVRKESAYNRLSEKERKFVDTFLKCIGNFKNPKSVTITYLHNFDVTNSWAISVRAQNGFGGYGETDYRLYRNGELTETVVKHVRSNIGEDANYNLELINEAIRELTL